jgi:hypothetical protein
MTKLSKAALEKHIRQTARDETSRIIFTKHANARMRERKITMPMALDCLRHGHIRKTPEPNLSKGTTECRMEHYTAGMNIGLVVAVAETDPNLIIVTAMNIGD